MHHRPPGLGMSCFLSPASLALVEAADRVDELYGPAAALDDTGGLPRGRLSDADRAARKIEQQRERELERAIRPLTAADRERVRLAQQRRTSRAQRRGGAL